MDTLGYVIAILLFGFRFYCMLFGPKLPRGRKPPSGGTRVKTAQRAKMIQIQKPFAFA